MVFLGVAPEPVDPVAAVTFIELVNIFSETNGAIPRNNAVAKHPGAAILVAPTIFSLNHSG